MWCVSFFVGYTFALQILTKATFQWRRAYFPMVLNKQRIFNIYIFIAFALDESVILNVLQFTMQNIYWSCDLGRAIGRGNVNASQ